MLNFLNFMPQKILIAQDIKELKFLLNSPSKNFKCLPLDLKTQLFCVDKKIDYFDLLKFSNNELHSRIQNDTEKIIDQIDINYLKVDSFREEFIGWLRARIYSIIFLIIIIEKINSEDEIKEIIVSGCDSFSDIMSQNNYFLSFMINNIFKNIKITNITNDYEKNKIELDQKFYSFKKNDVIKKRLILLSSLGYNFKRIFFWAIKNNYSILFPVYKKLSFFKKIIYKFLRIHPLEIVSKTTNRKELNISFNKDLSYRNIPISNCIFYPSVALKNVINNYEKQADAINSLFKHYKLDLAVSNTARGMGGCILEKASENKVKTLCIPHGTLSGYFNEKDKLYKKIISQAIVPSFKNKFAVQSKICENFTKINKINNFVKTGNLIFNESEKRTGNNILYAVTLKDFHNMQFYGVETFYEFVDNLKFLNNFSKKINKKIIVKPHPQEFDSIIYLQDQFKNLIFTNEKNSRLFKKIILTISFSSTIIEDSLYSKVPVILFDRWKRYQHCHAEKDPSKKNSAIYYIDEESNFQKCINTILDSDQIDFSNFIFSQDSKNNLDKTLRTFLN